MDYWQECITEAFEDAGIDATKEQINTVASWVSGAHENYGMAHGYDCISNPRDEEISELKRKLEREKNKIICKECKGTGVYISYGPYHSAESSCFKCNGAGFV